MSGVKGVSNTISNPAYFAYSSMLSSMCDEHAIINGALWNYGFLSYLGDEFLSTETNWFIESNCNFLRESDCLLNKRGYLIVWFWKSWNSMSPYNILL